MLDGWRSQMGNELGDQRYDDFYFNCNMKLTTNSDLGTKPEISTICLCLRLIVKYNMKSDILAKSILHGVNSLLQNLAQTYGQTPFLRPNELHQLKHTISDMIAYGQILRRSFVPRDRIAFSTSSLLARRY